ncbi:MAG: hypothetical protein K2X07_08410 [Caulobacteraceae bacterium]|nr:hypothetical protein [Caulobacteraceae bacterium]
MRPIFWRRCDGTRPCLATGGRRRGAGLRSALRISAIALIAACATPASAQTVTLRPGSDGVTVEYDLGRKADLLIFEDQDTVRADWSTPTPDVVISQDGLRSARPLDGRQFAHSSSTSVGTIRPSTLWIRLRLDDWAECP